MSRLYTEQELLKKFKGVYINTYPTYDYSKGEWLYEVRGKSKTIRENYNLPEDEIVKD
jgi:hypothetical protein